ncbi:MAG: hypothetical protein LBC33_00465 [Mycoplasmataceae bacterium]|jgi:hypothetical protein|nr:hypothetical protein [Mycoplasmataceae bacterium]
MKALDSISEVLEKNNLKVTTCEYGTNGLLARLITQKKNYHKFYLGGLIFTNDKTLNDLLGATSNKNTKAYILEFALKTLRKIPADICIATHLKKNILFICIIFLDKNYIKEITIDKNDPVEAAALSLTYFSSFIDSIKK